MRPCRSPGLPVRIDFSSRKIEVKSLSALRCGIAVRKEKANVYPTIPRSVGIYFSNSSAQTPRGLKNFYKGCCRIIRPAAAICKHYCLSRTVACRDGIYQINGILRLSCILNSNSFALPLSYPHWENWLTSSPNGELDSNQWQTIKQCNLRPNEHRKDKFRAIT